MKNYMYEKLKEHIGHNIVCVCYGDEENPVDICIECEDCGCVLVSAEDFEPTREEKQEYCKQVIIPDLRKEGVTLEQITKELDYRSDADITEAREGWDDDLYLYSTEELEDAEELWEVVK